MVPRPRGVVTFLFTDVEGSTRRWESDATSMREALIAHDDVMREIVAAHDGWLFKHTGDGVCAAFVSPRSAVDAAIAAQRAVGLPVRMGIATGEADVRDDDYFGAVLNRTARVMAAGHGGQVLVDGVTAELLPGVDVVAKGARRLRDIARPVELFQIRAAGLRAEFPPLRTADTAPGNLRPPTTRVIGRETELADVDSALKGHRLVTLTGVGGVGKTRLALEVAARAAPDFPDGVWVIELAAITDPAVLADAVAGVLGIRQQPGLSMADSVATALEDRSRLLVFDNCEHVLASAADIVDVILSHSATVKILATSREGLRVTDEHLWPVPPLDTMADSAAATLFAERAEAAAPGVSLDSVVVNDICRRLDGIPLAIELAASRLVSMTATEVRDRLNDRFRLLIGSRRGLERHQTLRHAVQWSYDLLNDDEQALLDRCSVFAGGFDLAGACAVAGSEDDFATLDLLDALVRKSLLVADRSSSRTRFSMLETIRQFAEDQLVAHGLAEKTRTAHARFFAGLEKDIVALWDGPRQREAYDWFAKDVANIRTAFRWAAEHGDLDSAAAIAVYAFLGALIEQYEPIGWAEELIEPAKAVEHRRLVELYIVASQCCWVGRVDDAIRYSECGQRLLADKRFTAFPLQYEASLGAVYIAPGLPWRWAEVARLQLEHRDDSHGHGRASLVMALSLAGAHDEAIALTDGLLEQSEATHNPFSVAQTLLAVGLAYRYANPRYALQSLKRALETAQASGNRFTESHIAVTLGPLAAQHGSTEAALDYLRLAIGNYLDSGNIVTSRSPLANLAGVLCELRHYESAATIAEFADDPLTRMAFSEITTTIARLREELGDDRYEALARVGRAMTNAAMANYAFEQIDLARAQLSSPPAQT